MALTVYALTTKNDFTMCGGFLFIACTVTLKNIKNRKKKFIINVYWKYLGFDNNFLLFDV